MRQSGQDPGVGLVRRRGERRLLAASGIAVLRGGARRERGGSLQRGGRQELPKRGKREENGQAKRNMAA
jgi:hypothetical protein